MIIFKCKKEIWKVKNIIIIIIIIITCIEKNMTIKRLKKYSIYFEAEN